MAEAAGGKAEEIREKEPEEELKIPEVAVAPEEELEIPEIAEVPEVSEPTEPEDETAEVAMAAFEAPWEKNRKFLLKKNRKSRMK